MMVAGNHVAKREQKSPSIKLLSRKSVMASARAWYLRAVVFATDEYAAVVEVKTKRCCKVPTIHTPRLSPIVQVQW